MKTRAIALPLLLVAVLCGSVPLIAVDAARSSAERGADPHPRHECGFVESGGVFYLLGGRRIQPIDRFDPDSQTWESRTEPPVEIHHFQPVAYKGKIYIIGAMTGGFPNETPLPNILIYDPSTDTWSEGDSIPEDRRRGSAGLVLHEGIFYLVGGIQRGHMGGFVNWFDAYDPEAGTWSVLPDAPHARDHFCAAIADGKLVAAGGRTTSRETGQTFQLTVESTDVFDFKTARWSVEADIPTPRAGTAAVGHNSQVIVLGGESGSQQAAHDEVEAFDVHEKSWSTLPPMKHGRHGMTAFVFRGSLYICGGNATRGGGNEIVELEKLELE